MLARFIMFPQGTTVPNHNTETAYHFKGNSRQPGTHPLQNRNVHSIHKTTYNMQHSVMLARFTVTTANDMHTLMTAYYFVVNLQQIAMQRVISYTPILGLKPDAFDLVIP